ncbi:hypothetical protein [Gracilimonas sp.]|uniref:hypothetical protein n=1 Tax=Gracilimonas sp. TaxID=1974203 RepID=UPI0032EA9BB6
MNFFRTHITRTLSVGLLLAGMVFYFMKPVSDNADHDAFTSWLQSNLKSNGNTSVVDQLKELSASPDELESVIRQASALVKAHADDFELPVDAQSKDESEVFQVLLKEWNAYQNSSSGMGKAVLIKQAQPHSVLPVDGLAFYGKADATQQTFIISSSGKSFEHQSVTLHNFHISPLSGGTAIGAP